MIIRKKTKKQGSILINSLIAIIAIGIISGGIFVSISNIINLSNKQKDYLYLENTLLSEINYYSSLKLENIESKNYTIKNNNSNINVNTYILNQTSNSIELKIEVYKEDLKKSQTINLIKQ